MSEEPQQSGNVGGDQQTPARPSLMHRVLYYAHRAFHGSDNAKSDSSAMVGKRVAQARQRQLARSGVINSQLDNRETERVCELNKQGQAMLEQAMNKFGLSARAYHRILKVARTIADLAESKAIQATHLGEALRYRCLDRPTIK